MRGADSETVDARGGLAKGALFVIAHVNREPSAHGVVGGASTALQVPRFEGKLGDVGVVQGVTDLLENEARGGLEVQGGAYDAPGPWGGGVSGYAPIRVRYVVCSSSFAKARRTFSSSGCPSKSAKKT